MEAEGEKDRWRKERGKWRGGRGGKEGIKEKETEKKNRWILV